MKNINEIKRRTEMPIIDQVALERDILELMGDPEERDLGNHKLMHWTMFSEIENATLFYNWLEKQTDELYLTMPGEIQGDYLMGFILCGEMLRDAAVESTIKAIRKSIEYGGYSSRFQRASKEAGEDVREVEILYEEEFQNIILPDKEQRGMNIGTSPA